MTKRLLIAFLASMAIHAQSAPVVFTNTQYTTSAGAVAESLADYQTSASPPDALPVSTSAVAIGSSDFAAASGLGAPGLLSATAEVDSLADFASATGQSEFTGSFTAGGRFNLLLSFLSLSSVIGDASAGGSLFVTLTNTVGGTLFDDVFTDPGSFNLGYYLADGSVTTLHLLLVSEAAAGGAGQSGSNFAQLSFEGTIPEPSTSALVLLGLLGAVAISRGKRRSHRQPEPHAC